MTPTARPVAYLFPGQNSQQVGMGRDLYENHPLARELFDQADAILGYPLSTLCFAGPKAELDDTVNTQPAIYVTCIALWSVLETDGRLRPPSFLAGHSLGELSALTAAGSLPFADGVRLVRARGEAMKAAGHVNPGGMAAVLGAEDAVVADACREASVPGEPVQVANYNCPGQVVISGATPAVERAMAILQERGVKRVRRLDVSIAAHSTLMQPAVAEYGRAVNAASLSPPRFPLVANLTARPVEDVETIRAELIGQLTGSVRWTGTIQYLSAQGVETFVEVGPGDVLTGLVKRIAPDSRRANISSWAQIEALPEPLRGSRDA